MVVVASARLLEAALALAAPVVVALWLTDLALGMVARVAPQVPVYFVGLPAKGLLAVGVVLLGLGRPRSRAHGRAAVVDGARAAVARGLGLTGRRVDARRQGAPMLD